MNINKCINMLLISISKKDNVFYIEKKTYKECKVYKSYVLKIGKTKNREFKSQKDLLLYLKELI